MARRNARRRSYGLLVDGSTLTAVTVENAQAVHAEVIPGPTGPEALRAWWARVRPKDPVTVSLLSPAESFAEIEIDASVPDDLVPVAVQEAAGRHFRSADGPLAVAAQLERRSASPKRTVRVLGVPTDQVVPLRDATGGRETVRFTVPAFTMSVDGLHLVAGYSATELVLLAGGRLVEAFVLATGPAPVGHDGTLQHGADEYGDQVATEVAMVVGDWARKGLPVMSRQVLISGPGALVPQLAEKFAARGFQLVADPIAKGLDVRPLTVADANRPTNALRMGLAAAAALADLDGTRHLIFDGTGLPARRGDVPPAWRKALVGLAGIAVLGVGAAGVLPGELGAWHLSRAQAAQDAARRQVAALGYDIALYDFDTQRRADVASVRSVDWAALLGGLLASAPAGVDVADMAVVENAGSVAATITATAAQPALVPQWLAGLGAHGASATVDAINVAPGGATSFVLKCTVPTTWHLGVQGQS